MSSQKLQQVKYLANLLGRKRVVVEREINSSDEEIDERLQLIEKMVLNETKLEEQVLTETVEAQLEVEEQIKGIYDELLLKGGLPPLNRKGHIGFLRSALRELPPMFIALDASQPWIFYWSLNALYLIGAEVPEDLKKQAGEKLLQFIHPDGGMGGGLGQLGHVAATYAGINALALLQDEQLWAKLDREAFYRWLLSIKQEDGSFVMHVGGEKDTRAAYCALSIASLLNIVTPELIKGTPEWLSKCQTFEGGFGGVPFDEAHGGYTFCATAALFLLGKDVFLRHVNLDKLVHWTVTKQLSLEGGFSGRSNKLVDGCYSFWVGGIASIFDVLLNHDVISREGLQDYILGCCQNEKFGGLRDKPGKHPDFYHTNYVLLGLSTLQDSFYIDEERLQKFTQLSPLDALPYSIGARPTTSVIISEADRLAVVNTVFALPEGIPQKIKSFFLGRE